MDKVSALSQTGTPRRTVVTVDEPHSKDQVRKGISFRFSRANVTWPIHNFELVIGSLAGVTATFQGSRSARFLRLFHASR